MDQQQHAVTPERIMQFAWGFAPPLVIEAGIRHKVFDALDAGPKTVEEVAAATGASARGLRAIMNCLVGLELLKKSDGKYELTPESSTFLVTTKPSFFGGMVAHTSGQLMPPWLHISDVVKTGKPAAAVNLEGDGSAFFQELVSNIFPMSYGAAQALAKHLNFGEAGGPVRVLDLGAGSGVWGIAVAQSSPRVEVTAVDWPAVLPIAQKTAAKFGLAERYKTVPGDLATADFGRDYDVITIGHILHSEGVERSKQLLRKCFDALAPGGTIAIQEFLVNADHTGPPMGVIFAVNMLINTENGDTWSFEEIAGWLKEVGFANPRLLEAPGPSPLILATKG
ncbi:MAG TPA: class I SAM-dependent methyltransferase [Acidobacteriaceae bacterium]|jgi:SAM-dependent methyltransferase